MEKLKKILPQKSWVLRLGETREEVKTHLLGKLEEYRTTMLRLLTTYKVIDSWTSKELADLLSIDIKPIFKEYKFIPHDKIMYRCCERGIKHSQIKLTRIESEFTAWEKKLEIFEKRCMEVDDHESEYIMEVDGRTIPSKPDKTFEDKEDE